MRVEYKISESDLFEAQVTHGGRWTKLMPLLGLLLITVGVISPAENPPICKLNSSNPGWIVLLIWLESSGSIVIPAEQQASADFRSCCF